MPMGRGGGVDCGDSVDMGGVFLPIRSRQALAETIPMDRSLTACLARIGSAGEGMPLLRECRLKRNRSDRFSAIHFPQRAHHLFRRVSLAFQGRVFIVGT